MKEECHITCHNNLSKAAYLIYGETSGPHGEIKLLQQHGWHSTTRMIRYKYRNAYTQLENNK